MSFGSKPRKGKERGKKNNAKRLETRENKITPIIIRKIKKKYQRTKGRRTVSWSPRLTWNRTAAPGLRRLIESNTLLASSVRLPHGVSKDNESPLYSTQGQRLQSRVQVAEVQVAEGFTATSPFLDVTGYETYSAPVIVRQPGSIYPFKQPLAGESTSSVRTTPLLFQAFRDPQSSSCASSKERRFRSLDQKINK